MNPDLEGKLFTKYPKIFDGTLVGKHIKCDDGWYKIIDVTCCRCQNHCDGHPEIPQIRAWKIREYFGMLCFGTIGGDKDIWEIIRRAESKSMETCEKCGTKGDINFKGVWLKCLCSEHKNMADEPADIELI